MISLRNVGFTYRTRSGLLSIEKYQALDSINLEVFPGETLGVIGSNGSGKSTLLKILAGIYRPDQGSISATTSKISLLSLSLGFDPLLSGVQNALLSSMLLGASKSEAKQCLDRIVEFSELKEFIFRPVRTYSNGMRARLGFSVALNMKADVLLIDEALAVGDAKFRKKSEQAILKKLSGEQTVVMVSHSIAQIVRICNRVIYLKGGRVVAAGKPEDVIDAYKNE